MRLSKQTVFFLPEWLYLLVLLTVNIAYLVLPVFEFVRFGLALIGFYCLYMGRDKLDTGSSFLGFVLCLGWIWLLHPSHAPEKYPGLLILLAIILLISNVFIWAVAQKKLEARQSKGYLRQQLKKIRSRPSNPQVEVDLGMSQSGTVGSVSLQGIWYSLVFLLCYQFYAEIPEFVIRSLGVKWFLAIIIPLLYAVGLYYFLEHRATYIQYYQAINDAGGQWIRMDQHGITWQSEGTLFPEPVYYDVAKDPLESEYRYSFDFRDLEPLVLPTSVPPRDTSIKTFIAWEQLDEVKVYPGSLFQSATLSFCSKPIEGADISIGMTVDDGESVYVAEDLKTLIMQMKQLASQHG